MKQKLKLNLSILLDEKLSEKDRILKELEIQASVEGKTDNIILLLKLLDYIETKEEFYAFTTMKFHSYGKYSYQSYRFYYLKDHFISLFNN